MQAHQHIWVLVDYIIYVSTLIANEGQILTTDQIYSGAVRVNIRQAKRIPIGVHSICPCLRYSMYARPIFTNSSIASITSITGNTTSSTTDFICPFAEFHVPATAPATSPSACADITARFANAITDASSQAIALLIFFFNVSILLKIHKYIHRILLTHRFVFVILKAYVFPVIPKAKTLSATA